MNQHPQFEGFIETSSFIAYARIEGDIKPTGNTQHFHLSNVSDNELEEIVMGEKLHPEDSKVVGIHGLIIINEDAEDAYYLFGCDKNWEPRTDTWHKTLDDAKDQAEYEYTGINQKWIIKKSV